MVKAIFFDKDGTLLEFSTFWMTGTKEIIDELDLSNDEKKRLSLEVGVDGDGNVLENSILAAGTISDLAKVLGPYSEADMEKYIEDKFIYIVTNNPDQVRPTCDIKKLFHTLKMNGIRIIIATSDNLSVARKMFEMVGVMDDIDFIISGDKFAHKPDPSSQEVIFNKFDLSPADCLMVGDSRVDMEYGKTMGGSVGVLCGTGSREMLERYTEVILDDPLDLIDYLNLL